MADYTTPKQSDVCWVAASQVIKTPADTVHRVVKIPQLALVTDIIISKTVGFSLASATVTIGFTGNNETADPDAFMSSVVFDPTRVGTASMKSDNMKYSAGKYFARAGGITVTTNKNGGTAGTFQVFVVYTQIKQ